MFSFWSDRRLFLWLEWRMDISDCRRFKAATPERRTGVAYKDWILREEVGFKHLLGAAPDDSKANRALVWALTLAWMWGRLPWMLLTIPTCSAALTNLIKGVVNFDGTNCFLVINKEFLGR